MPYYCYINGCGSDRCRVNFSFHRIPKDPKEREIWIQNINRPAPKNWDHVRICSRHFVDGGPTKANPYPVLHLGSRDRHIITASEIRATSPTVDALVDICAADDRGQQRISRKEKEVAEALLDLAMAGKARVFDCQCLEHEEAGADYEKQPPKTPPMPLAMKWPFDPETPEHLKSKKRKVPSDHDPSPSAVLEQPLPSTLRTAPETVVERYPRLATRFDEYATEARPKTSLDDRRSMEKRGRQTRGKLARWHSAGEAAQQPAAPVGPLRKVVSDCGPSTSAQEKKVTRGEFLRWSWFEGNDKTTRYYTGMPKFETLATVFAEVADDAAKISLHNCSKPKVLQRLRKLDLRDEFLITLIRIRQNFDNVHLAHIYGISESYVSRILTSWIPFLAKKLRAWVMWIYRDEQCLVPCVALFPRCVAIMDCFELYIEKPTLALERQYYWSQYKHHYTVKFLVCMSPNGSVMYMSPAWSGRTSDVRIVKESEEFLRNLFPGDVLLADRGFDVKSFLLARYRTQLLVPKFLNVPQLPGGDVDSARKLSSARIHVERVIGQLRTFRILHDICPVHMLEFLDDIAIICAAILNMHPPIVPM